MRWRYSVAFAAGIACSPTPPAPSDAAASTSDGVPISPPPPVRPQPGLARGREALEANAACEVCHRAEAAAWRGSRHHRSATNPAYVAAIRVEPQRFCRSCHAPESDADAPLPQTTDQLGVGCVTCHQLEPGVVLAAGSFDEQAPATPQAPHRIQRTRDFSSVGGCANCHEFSFPGVIHDATKPRASQLMQGTLTEHAESKAKDRPCAACHMPLSEGTRDHGFGQVRDAAWLQKKLTVEARATSWRSLQIRLTQRNPAHGFPTGDLFRRLEVGGERVSKAGFVEQRELAHLGRRFVPAATGVGREQVADDRLFDTTSVELDVACAEANGARVRWWVSLQRVAFEGQGSAQDEIESESRLAEGELPCQQLENPNETE